ncbi:SOS response-associated peptidase family protein [Luteolibacter yonseiensis]|uniref:SOS response-associated peptidase family protein n=1 Tax=Luteolibacter yonseiensis TaxID=1144680 RepID=A0A934R973_9BACT|nr:SOS response-associated peptidase family protein [Luteolibacter yonseiensis]MBK1818233.1 SOS response-associated peptidase family protein [Luteolibacter yonseiensis]
MQEAFTLAKSTRLLTDSETAATEAVAWGADEMFQPNSTALAMLPDGQFHHLIWGIRRWFLPCVHLIKCISLGDKSWKSTASRGRCVIPMTTFVEMNREDWWGGVFELVAKEGGLMWVAGIWDVVQRRPRHFAIITQ